MKRNLKLFALAIFFLPLISACSDSGKKSDSLLYGSLPGVVEEMQSVKEKFFEEAKAADSEEKIKTLMEKSEKLNEESAAKIEESAKSLDGREISFTEDDLKVTEPVSLTFEDFFSKTDMTPYFKVDGKAEAAKDIYPEGEYPLTYYTVYVVGYDAEGKELFTNRIGNIEAAKDGEKAIIKAGTPVKFGELQFSDKKVEGYQQARSLKLEARYK